MRGNRCGGTIVVGLADALGGAHGGRLRGVVDELKIIGAWGSCAAPLASAQAQGRRRMVNFYELFSKERREAGRKRLQAEMRKGHFDDFKVLRDTGGKLFRGSPRAMPARLAANTSDSSALDVFRGLEVTDPKEVTCGLTDVFRDRVRLLAVAVRDGAQPMLDAWIDAWEGEVSGLVEEGRRDQVGVVELSVVDSYVMRLPPFRGLLFRRADVGSVEGSGQSVGIGRKQVFMFTDSGWVTETFENRLVGYVYLLDRDGRVRWRGCGFPDEEEIGWLLGATGQVLAEGSIQKAADGE